MSQVLQNRFMIMQRKNINDIMDIWNTVDSLDDEDLDDDWISCRNQVVAYFKNKPMHYVDYVAPRKLNLWLYWHLRYLLNK